MQQTRLRKPGPQAILCQDIRIHPQERSVSAGYRDGAEHKHPALYERDLSSE